MKAEQEKNQEEKTEKKGKSIQITQDEYAQLKASSDKLRDYEDRFLRLFKR